MWFDMANICLFGSICDSIHGKSTIEHWWVCKRASCNFDNLIKRYRTFGTDEEINYEHFGDCVVYL